MFIGIFTYVKTLLTSSVFFFSPRKMYLIQHMLDVLLVTVSQHYGESQSTVKNMLQIAAKNHQGLEIIFFKNLVISNQN